MACDNPLVNQNAANAGSGEDEKCFVIVLLMRLELQLCTRPNKKAFIK